MSDEYKITAKTVLDLSPDNHRPYMLLSYSHKDAKLLDPLLQKLYEKGAKYWYDTELRNGENWFEKVCKMLRPEEGCCGAIIVFSSTYLLSASCKMELEEISRYCEQNKNFIFYATLDYRTEKESNAYSALLKKAAEDVSQITDDKLATMSVLVQNTTLANLLTENGSKTHSTPLSESTIDIVCDELYRDVFQKNGCTMDVDATLMDYARSYEEVRDNREGFYTITYGKIVSEIKRNNGYEVRSTFPAVWTVYNADDKKLYLLLNAKPMGACGRILAKRKLEIFDTEYILSEDADGKKRVRLEFDPKEQLRLLARRFLLKKEREDAKLKKSINKALSTDYDARTGTYLEKEYDPEANGYFFVMAKPESGEKEFYYADCKSTDVYENVWRDEIASLVPVIEIARIDKTQG